MNDIRSQLNALGFKNSNAEAPNTNNDSTKGKSNNNRKSNNKQYNDRQYNNKQSNNHNNNNKQYNNNGYVGAPYNFVPISKKVIEKTEEDMKVHAVINDDLLSGEISYKITAQTPIFISDGNEEASFVTNERHEPVIPGSTIRGLIRNNVQILGLSSIADDIDDYKLMYRKVGAKKSFDKERYEEVLGAKTIAVPGSQKGISVLLNVKAGYIAKKGKQYVIYQTVVDAIKPEYKDMNYYILSERTIANDIKAYPFFDNHPECLQNKVEKGFIKIADRNPVQYKGVPNKAYTPSYYNISYNVKNLKNIINVKEPGECTKDGVLVCTGSMNNKKALYIIPKIDETKEVLYIPDEDITAFKIDYEKKKNTLKGNDYNKKNLAAFQLPKEGEVKPVFYIYLDGRLYFGFTPRLRLFYDHSIKDGLKQDKSEFDYAKSIFGTIKDKSGFKSKVAFTDAVVYGVPTKAQKEERMLAEPKPSSCLDYLDQRKPSSYNSPDITLRGIKQYWLRDKTVPNIGEVKDSVKTTLRPLATGTTFTGKIRFINLTQDELGLLLWSIRLEKDSMMNIGMGKSYGFGAISISDIELKTINHAQAYSLDGELDFNPFEKQNVDVFIDKYKEEANKHLNGKKIEEVPSVQNFFLIKDSTKKPAEDKIRYMNISDKEYQNRTKPLQTIKDLTT